MSRYLERILIDRYGALENRDVGPFSPGMNVVYGPNEAGKSTVASFVGGVLFGWEEAHGVRNTYRPGEGIAQGRSCSDTAQAMQYGSSPDVGLRWFRESITRMA